jgi:zinc protease
MVRTNNYWLNTVLALSQRHPNQLEWPTTIEHDYNSITTQDVNALASEYLIRSRAAIAVIKPEKDPKVQ